MFREASGRIDAEPDASRRERELLELNQAQMQAHLWDDAAETAAKIQSPSLRESRLGDAARERERWKGVPWPRDLPPARP
ncbi:MAG TPA: hypothetical protein VKJ00_13615 [Thermoanaerobaculia bacterium]|nr:hypothetical protein [Thermoanaerobaculia bacterium]